MKHHVIVAAIALLSAEHASNAFAIEPAAHIPRSQIEDMFAQIKANTPWDLSGKLLWGYYFTGKSKADLEEATKVLLAQGYEFVEILPPVDGRPLWQLHVEKIEHQTPDSLLARDEELYALAAKLRLNSYDGMDVGPTK